MTTDEIRPQEDEIPDNPEEPEEQPEEETAEEVTAETSEEAVPDPPLETAPEPEPAVEAPPAPVPLPRRKATVISAVGAAVYLVAAVAVMVLVVVPTAPRALGVTPTDRLLAAASGLASAAEVHYTGIAGGTMRVDLKVGADGALHGTASDHDGGTAEVLALSGTTYARADRSWWLLNDPTHAGIYTGHWLTMTSGRLGFDAQELFTPAKLAKAVRSGLTEDPVVGTNTHRATTLTTDEPGTLRGTAVDVFHTRAGITAYVSTSQPYRLVAVDGPMSVAGGDGSESFALDLTVGSAGDRTTLNKAVHKAATGLDADKDPADPATYGLVANSEKQGSCSDTSCTESVQVRNFGSGPSKGTGYLLGRFVAGKPDGTQLGTCKTAIPALQPDATATVSCTVTSALWQAWSLLGGGEYYFESIPFSPGWQGTDPGPMATLDTHLPALDGTDMRVDLAPLEAIQVLNELLATKGWTGTTAFNVEQQVQVSGGLGGLQALLASGRFTLDPAYGSSVAEVSPHAWAEAARRLAAGSGKIAVGDWTAPDSTQYYGDVFDLGAHQVVHFAALVHPSAAEAVKDLTQAAQSFATNVVPPGFTGLLKVDVDPDSVLYRAGRSQIRTELERAGLTAGKLDGAHLLVDTAYGTVTFTPADFR